MFCNKCGNQIEEGASFCTQCGAKVVYNEEVMDAQIHTSDVGDEQMSDKLDVVLMYVGVI
ncbi:MAG: zinc ribbon domain-containing protein [Lachnospiraceae bacterium]|nr:zinc ribbon domain-containing protein [Lachnospiraceae bacterium]